MGMDLHRRMSDAGPFRAESYHANMSGWAWLLATAVSHGWDQAGTRAPTPGTCEDDEDDPPSWEWCGEYDSNDRQYVTAEDAGAWADALGRGQPYPGVSARWRSMIEAFIDYCREGGFEIW